MSTFLSIEFGLLFLEMGFVAELETGASFGGLNFELISFNEF